MRANSKLFLHDSRIATAALLAALAAVLVYIPALNNDFVNWDDEAYATSNVYIRSFDFGFLKWAFTSFHASNWHPVTWISHAVDYAVWGLNPFGHHLSSILLHGADTFLVVMLVSRLVALGRKEENESTAVVTGLITGLLFGLHPLHVESVAWVSERKDVLYAFFYLLSILVYLKYASSFAHNASRITHYGLSLALFALSLMSKPMAVTLPLVLLILDVYPLGRLRLRDAFGSCRGVLIEKIPFFLLSAASSVVTVIAQTKAIAPSEIYPLGKRLLVGARAFVFYLLKMVWPDGLYPVYPYPDLAKVSLFEPEYAGSLALLAGLTVLSILAMRRWKAPAAAWAYYTASLVPVAGVVQAGVQAAADRYTYLPGLGPFFLAGLGAALFFERIASRGPAVGRRAVLAGAACAVMVLLSVLTVRQIAVWKDSFTLWNYELAKFPDNYTAFRGRGAAYFVKRYNREAIADFNRAIELSPADSFGYYCRGLAYGQAGLNDKAVEDFKWAIALSPRTSFYYDDLGAAYGNMGLYRQAIENFDIAIKLNPRIANTWFRRGAAYGLLGMSGEAERDLLTADRLGDKKAMGYLQGLRSRMGAGAR